MAGSLVRHAGVKVRSRAAPDEVFDAPDEHRNLAAHRGRGSLMMGGGGMMTTVEERGGRAVGSRIAMTGRAFGVSLGLKEVVTEREPPTRKVGRPSACLRSS